MQRSGPSAGSRADSGGDGGAGRVPLLARDDQYEVAANTTLAVDAAAGVLANDSGSPLTLVSYESPAHGELRLRPDGSFIYTPSPGYTGADSFTYTVTDAVALFRMDLPPLATLDGVKILPAFGSALCPVPGVADEYYGLTDRGPNVDGPNDTKVEPVPEFSPAIVRLRLRIGQAMVLRIIPLRDASGNPYSGRLNALARRSETIIDLDGTVLPLDRNGIDSEGLVALPDGTFWVSEEYGPFITHFDADGRYINHLSPYDGSLPVELANRAGNRGLEGLTITPDGETLVGMLQSALNQPDLKRNKPKQLAIARIVTCHLPTGVTRQYLYLMDDPARNKTAVSDICALTNTTFLVTERDEEFPPGAWKKVWKIDITDATDVGPAGTVAGGTYAAERGGLLVGGQTLERLVEGQDSAGASAVLATAGIQPVSKSLHLDVGALLESLDARSRFFAHDKLEGLVALDGGRRLILSNDSDFGIGGVDTTTRPYRLLAKVVASTGEPDAGEFLLVDLSRLPAATSTATVRLAVR